MSERRLLGSIVSELRFMQSLDGIKSWHDYSFVYDLAHPTSVVSVDEMNELIDEEIGDVQSYEHYVDDLTEIALRDASAELVSYVLNNAIRIVLSEFDHK